MADFLYGRRVDPYRGFRFRVLDMSGAQLGGFVTVDGLRDETEVVEYREGIDGITSRKLPGFTSSDNLVLERGLSVDNSLQKWRDEVWSAKTDNTQLPDAEFRRDLIIELLDHRGQVVKKWKVIEAWPAIYEVGTMDATSSDVLVEHMELANEGHYLMDEGQGYAQVQPLG